MMIIKPYNREMGNNNTRNDLRKKELKFILFADDAIFQRYSKHISQVPA
jgi:ribosomal protein L7Ae-like RNA K-turn-binding protein